MRSRLWKIVFAVWLFMWVLFIVRGLVKGDYVKLKKLIRATHTEKLEYIMGEKLTRFLDILKNNIPSESTFVLEGSLSEHDKLRLAYYLYPRIESPNPDYLIKVDKESDLYMYKRAR